MISAKSEAAKLHNALGKVMKNFVRIIFAIVLSGCAELGLVTFDMDSMLLSPQPTPKSSYFFPQVSKNLVTYEAEGYELARSNQTTWLQFVDGYYQERDRLAPRVQETESAHEYHSYQRMLADQLDKKQITEIEWSYLLEKKMNDLIERENIAANMADTKNATEHAASSADKAAKAAQTLQDRQKQQAADDYYNSK